MPCWYCSAGVLSLMSVGQTCSLSWLGLGMSAPLKTSTTHRSRFLAGLKAMAAWLCIDASFGAGSLSPDEMGRYELDGNLNGS